MMRMLNRRSLIASLLAVAAFATPAIAQDEPRFALVASFPTPTVSFQWELNDRIAVRIDGSYNYRDQSTDEVTATASFTNLGGGVSTPLEQHSHIELSSNTGSIGVAGIFTFRRTDHIRLYLAPRFLIGFTHQRTSETTLTTGLPPGIVFPSLSANPQTFTREDSFTSPGGGVSFGAASNVFERIALFGEVGATYSRTNAPSFPIVSTSSLRSETNSKTNAISTRAVAGIMFRF
jgi:hypothetical protein